MEDNRTFKAKSFQSNMDTILERFDDLELYRLANYLNSKFGDTAPNDLQKEFIDEFFGHAEWAEFINDSKRYQKGGITFFSNGYIRCSETLREVREYLLFKMSHRFIDLLSDKHKAESELSESKLESLEKEITIQETELKLLKLKDELSNAIDNSVDGGIFDKADGWCNISDVLLSHKLINLDSDV